MDKQIKDLRRLARDLRPGVNVGKAGLSDNIIQQIRDHLKRHNLLKVRFAAEDRKVLAQMAARLAADIPCQVIETIGFTAVLHAPETEPE